MKTETVYVQVNCSEKPKANGWYFTSLGDLTFLEGHWYCLLVTKRIPELEKHPDWWLEKREEQVVMSKEEYYNLTEINLGDICL